MTIENSIFFANTDPASVEAQIISTYEAIAETTLYPGNPVRLFLESLAYTIATQNNVINAAGKQNLLSFAQSGHLDQVALMVGTKRLGDAPSTCTQRFELKEPLAFDVLVPAGTRVTTGDSKSIFAVLETATISAGDLSVETKVQASINGTYLNGLVIGQINKLIDPIAYIAKTENTSMTAYGSDVESDERLRARAQLAPESFTCAGPSLSYRYHTITAHQDIVDAAIWSPVPGTVDIRPILQGGIMPTQEILDTIYARVNSESVRPLTDTVIVKAPEAFEYELKVSWAMQKTDTALSASINARVAAAVEQYRIWQRSSPGRDIVPTKLISLMEQAGARRVIVHFSHEVLEPWQVAQESAVDVVFLGVESE